MENWSKLHVTEEKEKKKVVALLSGGLDSQLSSKNDARTRI